MTKDCTNSSPPARPIAFLRPSLLPAPSPLYFFARFNGESMAKTATTKKTIKAKQPAAEPPAARQPAHQPGQTVRVTIKRLITRAAARKTIERLFLKDRIHTDPLDARSVNFIPLPKRRGGCIWTKRP